MRLYAIFHDAPGFVYEYSEKGTGYLYVLPCPVIKEYLGHATGIVFLYLKSFQNRLFDRLEC